MDIRTRDINDRYEAVLRARKAREEDARRYRQFRKRARFTAFFVLITALGVGVRHWERLHPALASSPGLCADGYAGVEERLYAPLWLLIPFLLLTLIWFIRRVRRGGMGRK